MMVILSKTVRTICVAVLISLIFLSNIMLAESPIIGVSDIADYQWELSVNQLYEDNVINGYPDGTFQPDNNINRAELLKIVVEATYIDIEDEYSYPCFDDLTGSEWFAKYACLAKEEGIIEGYQDGEFKGNQPITQAEALKIIFTATEEEFLIDKGEWYEKYLNHAEYLGMYYFNILEPESYPVTRGEVAYFMAWLSYYDSDQISVESFYAERYENNIVYYANSAEECFENEAYDEEGQYCYLPCENEDECEAAITVITEEINNYDDYIDNYDTPSSSEESSSDNIFTEYDIQRGDTIILRRDLETEDPTTLEWQNNKDSHQEIWNYFTELIPKEYRQNLVSFSLFTDGKDEFLAWVEPDTNNNGNWSLSIDPEDAYIDGTVNKKEITMTLIHEFAHLFSLDLSQVSPSNIDGDLSYEEYWSLYLEADKECETYYTGSGCSNEDSYINEFYQEFWIELYVELDEINYILDDFEYYTALSQFYFDHQAEFITEYAATNPVEDFAESFTFFIIKPKVVGNSIADEKIRFFYNYPELVELRSMIREKL